MIKRILLLIVMMTMSGCIWKAIASLVATDTVEVQKENPEKPSHDCACNKKRGESAIFKRCTEDGTEDEDGGYYCCPKCWKVCLKIPTQ